MSARRGTLASLVVGVIHAAGLLAVALELGYSVGPSAYSPLGVAWRYGGLVVLGAVPVWIWARYGVVTPAFAVAVVTGYVLGMELTPPGPTFRDVAELERLPKPTGVIVVEHGLYIVRYVANAPVWCVGALGLGAVEIVVRADWAWFPPLAAPPSWLSEPTSRQAGVVAAAGGLLHAVAMGWFAFRLGVTISGGSDLLLYGFGVVGMWLLAAGALYALVRYRLVGPALCLVALLALDAGAEFTASVESPHALYFAAWVLPFGGLLLVAGVEYGLRRVVGRTLLPRRRE